MNMQNLSKSTLIVLVGFMGSGKSTIGKHLADGLGYAFIDTDEVIESAQKLSIPNIFEKYGEDYFRELEHQTIKELLSSTNKVVATGGGLPVFHDNMILLNENSFTIYIKADTDTLSSRLMLNSGRPLIAGKTIEDLKNYIENVIKIRERYYSKAYLTVNGNATVVEVLEEIHQAIANL